jgi:hypothetical protein
VVGATGADTISLRTAAGHTYLLQQVANPVKGMAYAAIDAAAATHARQLDGAVTIGIP